MAVKMIKSLVLAWGVSSAWVWPLVSGQSGTCPGFPGFCSETYAGQICVVVCHRGRPNVPLCQDDFTWTDIPRCIEHEPGDARQVPGLCPGISGYCSQGFLGQACDFPCPQGPSINSTCSIDGTWLPYPTCLGDIRETQNGCNPCPGPNGVQRNRDSADPSSFVNPRAKLDPNDRSPRPTFAGTRAFGVLQPKAEPQQPARPVNAQTNVPSLSPSSRRQQQQQPRALSSSQSKPSDPSTSSSGFNFLANFPSFSQQFADQVRSNVRPTAQSQPSVEREAPQFTNFHQGASQPQAFNRQGSPAFDNFPSPQSRAQPATPSRPQPQVQARTQPPPSRRPQPAAVGQPRAPPPQPQPVAQPRTPSFSNFPQSAQSSPFANGANEPRPQPERIASSPIPPLPSGPVQRPQNAVPSPVGSNPLRARQSVGNGAQQAQPTRSNVATSSNGGVPLSQGRFIVGSDGSISAQKRGQNQQAQRGVHLTSDERSILRSSLPSATASKVRSGTEQLSGTSSGQFEVANAQANQRGPDLSLARGPEPSSSQFPTSTFEERGRISSARDRETSFGPFQVVNL